MDLRGGTKLFLHDAVLETIEVLWQQRICRCTARPVANDGKTIVLLFSGVTEVRIPHAEPWGPSNSILELTGTEHGFVLTMQSGDAIGIAATAFDVEH